MTSVKPKPKSGDRMLKVGKKEIQEAEDAFLIPSFKKGIFQMFFNRGKLVNHLSMGIMSSLTLCGYFYPEWSSDAHITPLGMICPRCKKIYADAFKRWGVLAVETADEDKRDDVTATLEKIYSSGDWVNTMTGFRR
jgi:hypothetical protein